MSRHLFGCPFQKSLLLDVLMLFGAVLLCLLVLWLFLRHAILSKMGGCAVGSSNAIGETTPEEKEERQPEPGTLRRSARRRLFPS